MWTPPDWSLAGVTGLEPAASCVTGMRSNQLSYTPLKGRNLFEDKMWEVFLGKYLFGIQFAEAKMVGDDRLELPTLSL